MNEPKENSIQSQFKPSDIDLNFHFPPLMNVFNKSEIEAAATFLIACCQKGNEWKAVSKKEVQDLVEELKEGKEDDSNTLKALCRNPFWCPSFNGLVDAGFATWEKADPENSKLWFTEKGFEKLKEYSDKIRNSKNQKQSKEVGE
jgi:hypothetical protein